MRLKSLRLKSGLRSKTWFYSKSNLKCLRRDIYWRELAGARTLHWVSMIHVNLSRNLGEHTAWTLKRSFSVGVRYRLKSVRVRWMAYTDTPIRERPTRTVLIVFSYKTRDGEFTVRDFTWCHGVDQSAYSLSVVPVRREVCDRQVR